MTTRDDWHCDAHDFKSHPDSLGLFPDCNNIAAKDPLHLGTLRFLSSPHLHRPSTSGVAPSRKTRRPAPTPSNPFVEVPKSLRYLLLGLFIVYGATTVTGALLNSSTNPSCVNLALSTVLYLAALAFPIYTYEPGRSGWLHPLLFATLYWGVVRTLPRVFGLFIYGLRDHAALPLGPEELTNLVAYENCLNALAMVATYIGYYLARGWRAPILVVAPPKNLLVLVVASAVASVVALALYVRLSGSLFQHVKNLGLNATAKEFTEEVSGIGLYVTTAQWFALFLCIYFIYKFNPLARPQERLRFWMIWGAAFLAANAIGYLAIGKRSGMIIMLGLFINILIIKLRRVPWFRIGVLGAAVVVIFAAIQVTRGAAGTLKTAEDLKAAVAERTGESAANSMEELVFRRGAYSSVYPILQYVPSDSPLLLGETYLTIVTRPIPRSWWPTKPRGTDFRAGATFFGAAWGIPPGGMAEAYWNFHIPGVILVYLLYGVAFRWLANLYVANPGHGLVTVFFCYCLLNFQPAENALTGCLQMLIPFGLFALAAGVLRKRTARAVASVG